jgi:hypothetical protein
MRGCQLDHIAVTAPALQVGKLWVEMALGVELQAGGEHQRMGTHNALLRLGDSVYLEVIAINPTAQTPARPRWFGLDWIGPEASPRLATWIARTDDIHMATEACPERLGTIESMSRGSLSWLMTIPADGSLPSDGVVPTLIEWRTEQHPALHLENRGCFLTRLEAFHSQPQRIEQALQSLGLHEAVTVNRLPVGDRPHLVARIETPHGLRTVRGG